MRVVFRRWGEAYPCSTHPPEEVSEPVENELFVAEEIDDRVGLLGPAVGDVPEEETAEFRVLTVALNPRAHSFSL